MTSQINFAIIDATYPVAGQDNNSQGFRDNFTAVKSGLSTAQGEISKLQANTLKSADLATNLPVINNLLGSTLYNGKYKQLNGTYYPAGTVTSTTYIDVNNGPIQKLVLGADLNISFSNWPAAGNYSVVRLMLSGDGNAVRTPTFSTENGGVVHLETTTGAITLPTNGNMKLMEAFTVDKGSNVFLRYLGNFVVSGVSGTVTTNMSTAVNDGSTSSTSFTVASVAGINIGATFTAPPNTASTSILTVANIAGNTIYFSPAPQTFTTNFSTNYTITFNNP
jgi:hypothetical protein